MIVLAIETATIDAAAALVDETGTLEAFAVRGTRRHVETLHPGIEALLAARSLTLADLGGVAVDVGPGLFTGLRVGIAAAKTMAMALGVPLVGITSIEVLRAAAPDPDGVVPIIDMRRGEVAWVLPGHDDIQLGTVEVLIKSLVDAVERPLLLVGDGAERYRETLLGELASAPVSFGDETLWSPPAPVLGRLALARIADGAVDDPFAVLPRYLRDADATANFTTRALAGDR
jgi:tRNA threonylcarbamoyladenosine biosynthesis protein TsaB